MASTRAAAMLPAKFSVSRFRRVDIARAVTVCPASLPYSGARRIARFHLIASSYSGGKLTSLVSAAGSVRGSRQLRVMNLYLVNGNY
jgi:hypothetical protein